MALDDDIARARAQQEESDRAAQAQARWEAERRSSAERLAHQAAQDGAALVAEVLPRARAVPPEPVGYEIRKMGFFGGEKSMFRRVGLGWRMGRYVLLDDGRVALYFDSMKDTGELLIAPYVKHERFRRPEPLEARWVTWSASPTTTEKRGAFGEGTWTAEVTNLEHPEQFRADAVAWLAQHPAA